MLRNGNGGRCLAAALWRPSDITPQHRWFCGVEHPGRSAVDQGAADQRVTIDPSSAVQRSTFSAAGRHW